MERRQFIKIGVAGSVVLGAAGGGFLWLRSEGKKIDVSIDTALAKLNEFSGRPITANGAWTPYKVFTHCAQSVEFSISGYPQHKPELFKNTVGSLAFAAFNTARKMTHDLSEPIPGAPVIVENGDIEEALARLNKAYVDFRDYEGVLAPHFVYGELTKPQYAAAHVMHLYNHLDEIS